MQSGYFGCKKTDSHTHRCLLPALLILQIYIRFQ